MIKYDKFSYKLLIMYSNMNKFRSTQHWMIALSRSLVYLLSHSSKISISMIMYDKLSYKLLIMYSNMIKFRSTKHWLIALPYSLLSLI